MQSQRRKTRLKRAASRIRIGVILLGLFVVVSVVAFTTHGIMLWPAGFFVLVGGAYLVAGLWENHELKRKSE